MITKLKTLPINRYIEIKTGIELIYKFLGGVSAFLYDPSSYFPLENTVASVTASADLTSVTAVGSNEVLGYVNYTFTFVNGLSDITNTDYIGFEFPTDFFERYSDYSGVTCGTISCDEIHVFGVSNMIYLIPSSTIVASSTIVLTINNLINPAFS